MLSSIVACACVGLVTATYYTSPPPSFINRYDGPAPGYPGLINRPMGYPMPVGYPGGAFNFAQRVPIPMAYPNVGTTPLGVGASGQGLSQLLALLNTQSQLGDQSAASEPLVIFDDKNSESAQSRQPLKSNGNIVVYPLSKFRNNLGSRIAALSGKGGYVLANKKSDIPEKQLFIQNNQNGGGLTVGLGVPAGQGFPPAFQTLLSNLGFPMGNNQAGNGLYILVPPGPNQFQQTQTQMQTQSQGSKQPTGSDAGQYQSAAAYPLDTPEEDIHSLEDQQANAEPVFTSVVEETDANNEIIPIAVGEDEPATLLEGGTKRINKFGHRRRPGLYLIPSKFRYSKGLTEDTDSTTTTTEPKSNMNDAR